MSFLRKFFNFVDLTRKVILNLFFILALLFIATTFLVSDVKEDLSAVITFAPKKINETTNSNLSFFERETYELNLFEIIWSKCCVGLNVWSKCGMLTICLSC